METELKYAASRRELEDDTFYEEQLKTYQEKVKEGVKYDKEKHRYWWNGSPVPSVTDIMQDVGLIVIKGNKSDIDIAREFGKAVHLATELYDERILNEEKLDPKITPYLNCWKKFKHSSRNY